MSITPTSAGGAAARPPMRARMPEDTRPPVRLDRDLLRDGIARRYQEVAELEAALAADCEAVVARGRGCAVRVHDRETWDRAAWDRYLAAAVRFEPCYAPRMAALWRDIARLQRLANLPVPA